MARITWLLGCVAAVAGAMVVWLYVENRDLRAQLAATGDPPTVGAGAAPVHLGIPRSGDPWLEPKRSAAAPRPSADPAPTLPEPPKESRLERRQRRQAEFAAMFGRLDGETEEQYRARIGPMIATGLLIPRQRIEDMRKQVEAQAGVTPEQSKQLDQAFEKVYADALDYTNKAIADGVLSPYQRNVSGWLEYAGGLGGILTEANGQIAQILSAQQIQTIASSGFEWGEYLGVHAPWEQLDPPPPPP